MTVISWNDVARQLLASVLHIAHQRAQLPQGRHAA